MRRTYVKTDLLGSHVRVNDGHGIHGGEYGVVRAVYLANESSVFGSVMLLIANDKGEMFDAFASTVTLEEPAVSGAWAQGGPR